LKLKGPFATSQELRWLFRVLTDTLADIRCELSVSCDTGECGVVFVGSVAPRDRVSGDIIIYPSPMCAESGTSSVISLARIAEHLPHRVHFVDNLSLIADLRPRTLLLHEGGLLAMAKPNNPYTQKLHSFVNAGMNLVILAGSGVRGTIDAANALLSPYGIRFSKRRTEQYEVTTLCHDEVPQLSEVRHSRVVSTRLDIEEHELTRNICALYWHDASTIANDDPRIQSLVTVPSHINESYVVATRPSGYVVLVGTGFWGHLACRGWPYENDRFLAQLLLGHSIEDGLQNSSVCD
jgi:hypothetical protein